MKEPALEDKLNRPNLAFQPLYLQVADYIKQLIVERRWMPGDVLPSEFKLAEECRVSQGTVRKALNLLNDANIVSRHQGVGTFVSQHTAEDALSRFFPLRSDAGSPQIPEAQLIALREKKAPKSVQKALQLKSTDKVNKIVRVRCFNQDPSILETIFLPVQLFPRVANLSSIPDALYHFYQTQFNQTVQSTSDSIKAITASKQDSEHLNVPANEPLLLVTRITTSIEGKLIEYRQSKCKTDNYHYHSKLD